MAGMRMGCSRHGWQNDHWGWWGQSRGTGWWSRKQSRSWDWQLRSCGTGCFLRVRGLGGERKVPEMRSSLILPA